MIKPVPVRGARLRCPRCGNDYRFREVMALETHIVDGNFKYIHLEEAEADHYVCLACDEEIPAPEWMKSHL